MTMPTCSDRNSRLASFFQVLHPLELACVVIAVAGGLIGLPDVPRIIAAAAIAAVGALLRRAWVIATTWAALSLWLATGAPGLLFLAGMYFRS